MSRLTPPYSVETTTVIEGLFVFIASQCLAALFAWVYGAGLSTTQAWPTALGVVLFFVLRHHISTNRGLRRSQTRGVSQSIELVEHGYKPPEEDNSS